MSHCRNFRPAPISRRQMLRNCAAGFGAVAAQALMADKAYGAIPKTNPALDAWLPKSPDYAPKAKNIIFLYMDGGPSQVDTFDPKPMLEKYHGQDPREAMGELRPTQFDNIGKVMKSHWEFKEHGECGHPISSLFPHVATVADELAMIHSMTSEFPEHTAANYFLHTGSGIQGRPSMGAWMGYGLGSESRDLPGFVVLNGGLIPPGGLDCFGSGFLSASYGGSVLRPQNPPVANIMPPGGERGAATQMRKLDLLGKLDSVAADNLGHDPQVEAAIANYETAFQMQSAVPELMELKGESDLVKDMYGLNDENEKTRKYGTQCLLARRLVQRGVRFIELTCDNVGGDRWDQHSKLKKGHENNCKAVDQPIAALIKDLKALGMLDETLIVWSGEFGRTPFAQGSDGRDHNPMGFTSWMAGGGVKGGVRYGATDEWGYKAVQDRVEIHDLHATMLHLLGVEHTKSTYRWGGRDMRLTDVHGHVIHDILA